MRVTNALLIARAKALRENFLLTAIVLSHDDHRELSTEREVPGVLTNFLGLPIIAHSLVDLPPSVAVAK